MKKILTLACCFSLLICDGQQHRIDSVMALLKAHPKRDTAMLSLLRMLVFFHQETDLDQGIRIADSAIGIARSIGETGEQLGNLYNSEAVLYWTKSDNVTALSIYAKSEAIFRRLNLQEKMGNTYINIANVFINLSKFDSAIAYLDKAQVCYKKTGNPKTLIRVYNSYGVAYQYMSNLPRAIESYIKAQIYYEKLGDEEGLAAIYVNIGIMYLTMEQYGKALVYYEKALAIYNKIGGKQSIAETLTNMGNVYYELNNQNKALENFQQALEMARQTGSKNTQRSCLINLSRIYADKKEYAKAMSCLREGLALPGEIGNQQIDAFNILSKTILNAPDSILIINDITPATRYITAIGYARKSLQQANTNKNTIGEYYAWLNISDIYLAQRKYDKALDAYKQFFTLRDSVFKAKKFEEIANSQAQFNFDKEKLLIAAANERKLQQAREKELLNKAIIAGISIVLIIAAIFYSFYHKKKNRARVAEAEIKMLLAQMNPHFIFNALNSINSYIVQNGSDSHLQSYYLVKFSKLMRMVLEASGQKEISLAKDLEILEIYLQMEMRRTDNKFNYEIITDPGFDKDKVMVPPMLLQPFAENSIWHGFTAKTGAGKLDIRIVKEGNMISLMVKDNGIGREAAARRKTETSTGEKESLGLAITRQRIEMLNFKKQSHSSMNIYDLEQGTSVEIKIPLKETQNAA